MDANFLDINLSSATNMNELDEYLSLPVENVKDPLGWWHKHKEQYPLLWKMASDFLGIPGRFYPARGSHYDADYRVATSTAVERVFSRGRHLLHYTRSRLSGASVRAYMCLGDWSRNDLISDKDIMDALKDGGKRKRPKDD